MMVNMVEFLGIPGTIATCIIALVLIMQVIGEIMEFFGKTAPKIMKIRTFFKQKKQEKREREETQQEVKRLLTEVNQHYSADNITKRNNWMKWVNDKADNYDKKVVEVSDKIDEIVSALNSNTKMTEEMFVETKRDRIIDFSTKVSKPEAIVSKEEFNRIFRTYDQYENFIEAHELTNGEVEVAYGIIKQEYAERLKNNSFVENI